MNNIAVELGKQIQDIFNSMLTDELDKNQIDLLHSLIAEVEALKFKFVYGIPRDKAEEIADTTDDWYDLGEFDGNTVAMDAVIALLRKRLK